MSYLSKAMDLDFLVQFLSRFRFELMSCCERRYGLLPTGFGTRGHRPPCEPTKVMPDVQAPTS